MTHNLELEKTLWLIRIHNGVNAEGKPKYLNPLSWFYETICKPFFAGAHALALYCMPFALLA